MVSIVKYLYESNLSDAAKSAALIGGLVTGGGALYNKIRHGEAFGDEGIDVIGKPKYDSDKIVKVK